MNEHCNTRFSKNTLIECGGSADSRKYTGLALGFGMHFRDWLYAGSILICRLLLVVFSASVALRAAPAVAADRQLPEQRSNLDVVLLFDASGSMLKTDPQNLRYQGAKLLLSFLGEGDRLAVVQFAASAQVVQNLESFVPSRADDVARKIGDIKAEGEFTDISEGMKLGKSLLDGSPRAGAQRVIVLLSDGKVEPDPKVSPAFARTLELVHDLLPELKAKETKVFTLAFSDQADRAFLGEVAATTDGLTWFTQSAEDIHKSFAQLFLAMKRPQVVAQTGRGFSIDGDVEEATFYINHEPGANLTMLSPKGEELSAAKHPEYVVWFAGQNFDVITIKEPDEGLWQVLGTQAHDGFATVLTDLKLLTDWPLVVRAGDQPLVQARLYEESKPVSLPEMNGVVKFAYQISPTDRISKPVAQEALNDDGKSGDVVAADGIFSIRSKSLEAGAYKLTVVAKGPTFQRTQQIPFTVRPRLVSLSVAKVEDEFGDHAEHAQGDGAERKEQGAAHDEHRDPAAPGGASAPDESKEATPSEPSAREVAGDELSRFIVIVSKEVLALREFEVELIALAQDRQRFQFPMKRLGASNREFVVSADRLPKDGTYKLRALMKGKDKKGVEVEGESQIVSFTLKSRPDRAATPIVLVDQAAAGDGDQDKSPVEHVPVIPIGAVTLINVVFFTAASALLKRRKKKGSRNVQRYLPHKQLTDAIESLEERVSASNVEIDESIFKSFMGSDDLEGAALDYAPERNTVSEDAVSAAVDESETPQVDSSAEGEA